jgi:hypothetical protein
MSMEDGSLAILKMNKLRVALKSNEPDAAFEDLFEV